MNTPIAPSDNSVAFKPFDLGLILSTPGALAACAPEHLHACLQRHSRGDWGCVDTEDSVTNDRATNIGARILSAYPIDASRPSKGYGENTLWVITEADRSATTCLLPEEY